MAAGSPVLVRSARADGATPFASALAAVGGQSSRSLLIDLDLVSPEIGPLFNLLGDPNVYHLAYRSRFGRVTADALEEHVQWRDGIAILAGITHPEQRAAVADHFLESLLETAGQVFDHVVVDLGRATGPCPAALGGFFHLWVVAPSPLGLAALDSCFRRGYGRRSEPHPADTAVLNRVSDLSINGVERLLMREYGLEVVGRVPDAPSFWARAELAHSMRALNAPSRDHRRIKRAFGSGAFQVRTALEEIAGRLASASPVEAVAQRS